MMQHEAESGRSRKKLAIISTYNENCGNASYTHVLKVAFSRYVDVDVIPLDLFLLQSTAPTVIAAGDDHIRDICARLKNYDYVNIQYEAGLYGGRIQDMLRRLKMLVDAAPNVTVTLHRVEYDKTAFWRAVKLGIAARSYKRFRMARGAAVFSNLSKAIVQHCAKAAKRKNVRIKVHTRRDRRTIQQIYKFDDVYDYPLAFLTPEERAQARAHEDRTAFLQKYGFEPRDKVVGLFGYLSNYKGIETAIESLKHLPKEYKLALFGSQHPQSVKRGETVNPYLKSLFELMEDVDEEALNYRRRKAHIEWLERRDAQSAPAADVLQQPVNDDERVIDRVRFIGSLPDPEFMEALRLTDVVVLPYQEVGQSMSGVAVLAMECGSKMICANNHSFFETRRYFSDCFASFDVGNAYELAQKVQQCAMAPNSFEFYENRERAFAKYNIDESVVTQLRNFGHAFAQEQK